jgi:hypothetical protein
MHVSLRAPAAHKLRKLLPAVAVEFVAVYQSLQHHML